MSDEPLPQPSPPFDDHADPTDEGYGYYEVEEYVGDPMLRPPVVEADALLDDIASERPLFTGRSMDSRPMVDPLLPAVAVDRQPEFDPAAFDPPRIVRPVRRPSAGFDPPAVGAESPPTRRPADTAHADAHAAASRDRLPPPGPRIGRVPFAERNWRIPTIVTLVVALIVIGAIILLLPDDRGADQRSAGLVELRTQPSKQWDQDLNGFASGTVVDGNTLYAVVAKRSTVEVVALDLAEGNERWRTALGPGTVRSAGDVALGPGGLTIVVDSGAKPGLLAVVSDTGKLEWQVPFTGEGSSIVSDSLVSATDPDGTTMISAIDRKSKKLARSDSAELFAIHGRSIYIDADGTLTKRSATTLEPEPNFGFSHSSDISAITFVDGEALLAIGEQLVRLTSSGVERSTFAPEVGVIRSLLLMQGNEVLVGSTGRMRVVAINDDDIEPITGVRTAVTPVAVAVVEDGELIIGSIASGSGGSGALRVLRVVDDAFEAVAEIEMTGTNAIGAGAATPNKVTPIAAPIVAIVGDIIYAMSYESVPRFIAVDFVEGKRLWSIPLIADDDIARVGRNGVLLFSREDDETIVTLFAPND